MIFEFFSQCDLIDSFKNVLLQLLWLYDWLKHLHWIKELEKSKWNLLGSLCWYIFTYSRRKERKPVGSNGIKGKLYIIDVNEMKMKTDLGTIVKSQNGRILGNVKMSTEGKTKYWGILWFPRVPDKSPQYPSNDSHPRGDFKVIINKQWRLIKRQVCE